LFVPQGEAQKPIAAPLLVTRQVSPPGQGELWVQATQPPLLPVLPEVEPPVVPWEVVPVVEVVPAVEVVWPVVPPVPLVVAWPVVAAPVELVAWVVPPLVDPAVLPLAIDPLLLPWVPPALVPPPLPPQATRSRAKVAVRSRRRMGPPG
jgi:hypothetical protein